MRLADVHRLIWSLVQWSPQQLATVVDYPFAVDTHWSVLGPFPIGTREIVWGADPLVQYGGFHSLAEDDHSRFASPLAFNGSVGWTSATANVDYLPSREVTADIKVAFPDTDWTLLQQVYGWSALQWQSWVRGKIVVPSDTPLRMWLQLSQVMEFRIADQHFFGGDLYSFNRAPTILKLDPGEHIIELRVVRDVRAMGGITDDPCVNIGLHLSVTYAELRRGSSVLMADRLDNDMGPVASTYASIVLRNDNDTDIYLDSVDATHNMCEASFTSSTPIKLAPGQSRNVGFQLACIPGTSSYASVKLFFNYHTGVAERHSLFVWALPRRATPRTEPHRITYQHPAGMVSYAILKPPLVNICEGNRSAPVLVSLHGAGLEADDDQVKHSLDYLPEICAWTLLPSGVTPWSSDDWHDWGWSDVKAAIDSIPSWMEQVGWDGPGVNLDRWIVSGHSNGGQGVWHAVTHFPDNVIAAAPVSGYAGIQTYVPYTMWQAGDPRRRAVIDATLSSHQHELMVENAAGIPMLLQHGSADDNVPAYHSRLLHQRLLQAGIDSTLVELKDQPHWWEGVMVTPPLVRFISEQVEAEAHRDQVDSFNFTLTTSNAGNTEGKQGLRIHNLLAPAQFGRLEYSISHHHCHIRSLNVRSFSVAESASARCKRFEVDGNIIEIDGPVMLERDVASGKWLSSAEVTTSCRRAPAQQGGLEAILRTNGTIQIVQHSQDTEGVALQIANNFCQYFGGSVDIADDYDAALARPGAIVSIAIGQDLPPSPVSCDLRCAVRPHANGTSIDLTTGRVSNIVGPQTAAIFLRPLAKERLELVLWATNVESLALVLRQVPTVTGGGQPDFVVLNEQAASSGIAGVLAMGFYDHHWCASSSSFFVDGIV